MAQGRILVTHRYLSHSRGPTESNLEARAGGNPILWLDEGGSSPCFEHANRFFFCTVVEELRWKRKKQTFETLKLVEKLRFGKRNHTKKKAVLKMQSRYHPFVWQGTAVNSFLRLFHN